MSSDPDTTRIVRSWLDEGVTQLPDRVLDAVLDQVPATPQRRATWWPARRHSTMNMTLKYGLAAAVVAVAALIGINYLGTANVGGPGIGDSTPRPEATVTPEPSFSASPTPEGMLPEGPHVLLEAGFPMSVTIPAPGWHGDRAGGTVIKNDTASAPDGAGLIVFAGAGDLFVYGDPCRWLTTKPDAPATTVDELVAALTSQASRDASEPVDVTLDGYAGKSVTLHVPADVVFSECDGGEFRTLLMGATGARYHQDPGQIDKLWIVDVDGELAVIDAAYYDGTPQAVVDELEAIVHSITFGE